jgi:predicted O-methyltransferase YrrM
MERMDDILRYLEGVHPAPDPLLLELEQHGRKDGIPIVSRETGRFLSVLVRMIQAHRILEIGTAYGYSTLWMAMAQPPIGKIWTIDPDSTRTEVASSYFKRAGEDDYITIFNQDALELLENFQQRNLDIVFIDANKTQYRDYLDLTIPMLKLSGIVVVDNCVLGGRVAADESPDDDEDVRAMREFNEYFLSHSELDATILPLGDGTGIGVRIR